MGTVIEGEQRETGQLGEWEQKEPTRAEKYAALRAKLIPIVRESLVRCEETLSRESTDPDAVANTLVRAVFCARALGDKDAAKRLLPRVLSTDPEEQLMMGILAIASGDEATARSIIHAIETQYNPESDCYVHAAYLAQSLSDKTIAKKFIRRFENAGATYIAAYIAVDINDTEAIARLMKAAETSDSFEYECLPVLAPFHPELAQKLMQQLEDEEDFEIVGVTAAVLGDRATAAKAMTQLKASGDYQDVSRIAAILGDVSTAEEMLWEVKKQDPKLFDDAYECHLQDSMRHHPEAAYQLMLALEKRGYEIGLIAARVLENLTGMAS